MKQNDLFVLKDLKGNILAISESKYLMVTFCLQIDFNELKYVVKKITDKNKITKYLIKYDRLYLIEYEDFVIREKDFKIFNDLIYFEMDRINNTIETLQNISDNCTLIPDEQEVINKTINLLQKKTKNKNFKSFINISQLIKDYYNSKNFREYMEEIYSRYFN